MHVNNHDRDVIVSSRNYITVSLSSKQPGSRPRVHAGQHLGPALIAHRQRGQRVMLLLTLDEDRLEESQK